MAPIKRYGGQYHQSFYVLTATDMAALWKKPIMDATKKLTDVW